MERISEETQEEMSPEQRKKRIAQLREELKRLRATPRSDWHSSGFGVILLIDTQKYGPHVRIQTEEVLGEEPPRTTPT